MLGFGEYSMQGALMRDHLTETDSARSYIQQKASARSVNSSRSHQSVDSSRHGKDSCARRFIFKDSIQEPIGNDFIVHYSRVLGRGYSGVVVEAVGRSSGVGYAVKTYANACESASKAKCCQRECEILGMVKHPHLARLVQVYEDDNGAHLVQELYNGGELYRRLMSKKFFEESEAKAASLQMLDAIGYLHNLRIVHRDVKLENWVYECQSDDAPLRLCDFGFARLWDQAAPMQTVCGTLPYTAPEVLNACYTDKCDLWSFGVIAFALISGSMPFKKLKDIKECNYGRDNERWSCVSDGAREFVAQFLVLSEEQRACAAEGIEWASEWVTDGSPMSSDVAPKEPQAIETDQTSPDHVPTRTETAVGAHGEKMLGDIVQTLLTCKQLHNHQEQTPLTDEEYDKLMEMYATLNNADRGSVQDQLCEFRNGVGQLRAAAKLYDAKMTALKHGSSEVAGSIRTLDDHAFKEQRAKVKQIGNGLVEKLQRLHRDPLLKSPLTDDAYDSIVKEHRMLDTPARLATVQEEESGDTDVALDDTDVPLACNEVYLRLVEVSSYKEAYLAGKPIVKKNEYLQKKESAVVAAQTFLASEESYRIEWARVRIEKALQKLALRDGLTVAKAAHSSPSRSSCRSGSHLGDSVQRLGRKMSSFSTRSAGSNSSYRSSSASGCPHTFMLEEIELPQLNTLSTE